MDKKKYEFGGIEVFELALPVMDGSDLAMKVYAQCGTTNPDDSANYPASMANTWD